MSVVRVKFTKTGALKFLGHLDVMRYFQKAIRRAELPVAYSAGYSPHMVMSFANPLGVGLTSEGEYFDIELTRDVPSAVAVRRLNETMADGIRVKSFRYLPDGAKTGMAIVAAADYLVFPKRGAFPPWLTEASVRDFLARPQIVVVKKTKKSEREVDIRPLIYAMQLRADGLFLRLSAGSVDNLKPQLVLDAFHAFCRENGADCDVECDTDCGADYGADHGADHGKDCDAGRAADFPPLQYHRLELYAAADDGFTAMERLGEERL